MPSCHDSSPALASPAKAGTLTVALAGNPNSGKTTIFNALTGLRQKVANYPGVTVEKKLGRCKLRDGSWCQVIDLPGTYSLISRSPDEQVAMEVLRGIRKDVKTPDVVIVVVDASNLQRNLYLVSQLIELGRPLVVALNMTDVAERRGLIVSVATLQTELGVPVIPVVGYKRKGIAELKDAIRTARVAPLPQWVLPGPMKEELLVVGGGLAILDVQNDAGTPAASDAATRRHEDAGIRKAERTVPVSRLDETGTGTVSDLESDSDSREETHPAPPRAWICRSDNERHLDRFEALAERLLIGDRAADLLPLRAHEPVASLVSHATSRLQQLGIDPMQADVEAHYHWIESVARRVVTSRDELDPGMAPPAGAELPADRVLAYARPKPKPKNLTERVDAIFIHRFWGLLVFALIMGMLFVSIFWLAQPIMDGIQNGINALGTVVAGHMSDGPLRDLVKDGIFAGVGTVVVFVPQIAMLFLFLSLLEDSGYLARAAFLMDRLLSKVGLHGKSFIPLLSSFACAIPGIMATRTIENRRERLATILVAPFMSCSARLPVYTLLIGAFFATLGPIKQAGIMLACYALGILAAAGTAFVFKRTLTKGPATSFILELPSYKIPQLSQVARQVWSNTKAFLTKAGTTIFCLSVILWAMAYYPRLPQSRADSVKAQVLPEMRARVWYSHLDNQVGQAVFLFTHSPATPGELADYKVWCENLPKHMTAAEIAKADEMADHAVAAAQAEYSLSGRLGHAIEPVLRPLGFDWKIDIGLISAFAAREVFVSSMGIVYSVGSVEEGGTANLSAAMQNDKYTYGPHAGRSVWTPMVAISLLVWFVLAMQCMSTFAIVRRETGGWGWPIFMLVYMNVLAYVVSLIVFQVGTRVFG
jgi:ferrous iron transport protein B